MLLKKSYVVFIIVFAASLIGVLLVPWVQSKLANARLSNIIDNVSIAAFSRNGNLQDQLEDIVSANPEMKIGVAVIDLNNGKQYGVNSGTTFHGASTTKVIAATTFLSEVEEGRQKLDSSVGSNTANYHLKKMINQSDNNSWNLISAKLGLRAQEKYAKSIGMTGFSEIKNTITPADQALLLKKLYNRELLKDEYTNLLLSYMSGTNDESLIPAALPDGAKVNHKYGQFEGGLHDTGVIEYKGRTYVLAIYTDGVNMDKKYRTEVIHDLTQTVQKALVD